MIKEKEKKLGPIIKSGIFLGSSKGAKSTQYIQRGPKYGGFCAGGVEWTLGRAKYPVLNKGPTQSTFWLSIAPTDPLVTRFLGRVSASLHFLLFAIRERTIVAQSTPSAYVTVR